MFETPERTRVGAQWLGLARQYRRDVKAEDRLFDAALVKLASPLRARLKRHPKLRHEMIAGTERIYRGSIPREFRIGDISVNRDRAAFSVSELRVAVSWIANPEIWPGDYRELGVTLCRFQLALRDGRLREWWTPLAAISLHALARRYERGRCADPPASPYMGRPA